MNGKTCGLMSDLGKGVNHYTEFKKYISTCIMKWGRKCSTSCDHKVTTVKVTLTGVIMSVKSHILTLLRFNINDPAAESPITPNIDYLHR